MSWGRRVTSAVAVFAVGSIAALPFYRGPLPPESPPTKAPQNLGANPTTAVALQIPASDLESTAPEPSATNAISNSPSTSAPTESKPTVTKRVAVEREAEPPIISSEFPSATQQVPQILATSPKSGSKAEQPSQRRADDEHGDGPKIHRIRDGDTLRKIAERYLKNGERWIEILDANRAVLRDPELLPVGKEIRIPEGREMAPQLPGQVESPPQHVPKDEPLTPLVPIR